MDNRFGAPGCTVSDGALTFDANAANEYIHSKNQYGVNYAVRTRSYSWYVPASKYYPSCFGFGNNHDGTSPYTGDVAIVHQYSSDYLCGVNQDGSGRTISTQWQIVHGTYYIYDILRNNGTSNIYIQNGVTQALLTTDVTITNHYLGIGETYYPEDGRHSKTTFDWVLVRKYTAAEPTISSWGSEES